MKKLNKKVFFMAAFLLYIVAAVAFNTLPKKDSPKALSSRYNDAYSTYKKHFPSSLTMPGVEAGANSMKLLVKDKFSILGLINTPVSYQDPDKHLEIPSQYAKPVTASRDGYWIRFTPNFSGKMNNVTAEVTGTTLVYPQVMQDLDIIQHLMPNGIKEDMILKSKNAPSAYTWTMEYDPRLTPSLENNVVSFYTKAPAPQPTIAENGSRHVQMGTQFVPEKKFEISPPYLMDTKGALHMKVQTAMTTHSLTFTIEKAWLEREATYPLLLDPTILYNTSAGYANGAFNMAVDEGSGTSPSITSARHELTADASTVLLYHMNEGTATSLTDASGNGYTAGVAGTTVVASGVGPKLGNARIFNGTSDNTGTSNTNQDLSGDLTIEWWMNATNIGTNRLNPVYKSYGGEFGMTIETSGSMSYYQGYGTAGGQYYGATLLPAGSLSNGKWYHIAIVRKGKTIQGYLNGTLVNSLTATINAAPTASQINIAYGYTGFFMGATYDELRIMKRAASAEEVARDAGRYPNSVWTSPSIDLTSALSWSYLSWMAKGVATGDGETPQSTSGLVAEWKFNETSGTTASNSIAAAADSWTTGATGGTARSGAAGVAYNGKIYYWGGMAAGGAYLNTMDIYDIAGNSWSTGATGGTARNGHAGVLYNGKIYYWGGLGNGGAYVNSVDIYDIAGNAWSIGNTGGTIRYNHSGAVFNGKIYSWGGANGTGNLNTLDIYDIANNTWTTGATGGTARNGHVGVLYSGKFYNWGGSSGGVNVNSMDIYDIASNSWSAGAAGGTARFLSAGDGYNGKLYFWGGFNGSYLNTVDVYDIAGNSWSTTTAGGTGRNAHVEALSGNKLYFWGGGNPSTLNTMDILTIGSSGCGAACNGTLNNFVNTGGQDIYSQEVESGGTISYVGSDVIHTFTAGGTLTLSRPKESLQALIVAGGGGGGVGQTTAYEAGGGGAGGVIYNDDWRLGAGSYGVAVGTGGTNANGGNSSFGGYTAIGGGKGGNGAAAGNPGGSGGGGSHPSTAGGAGTAGQGNNGGNGGTSVAGGGGGGGQVGNANCQGCGGNGYLSYIIGGNSGTYYGGGGGAYPGVSGGAGGGGASTVTLNGAVGSGVANTGGGGAGSYCSTGACVAGSGGSGVVIVRYPGSNPSGWTSIHRRWGAGALDFDGESDYVKVPDNSYLDATTGVTIAAWVNGRQFDAADFTHLVDKDGSYSLSVYYGKPAMYLTVGGWWTPSTPPVLQTGKWYYLVATYDGSYKRLYVNGVKVAEAAQSGSITPSALSLGIGGRQDGTILFNGTIDAVSIYNRGMTDAEVLSDYNAGQVEIQTRTSADNVNWEAWKPTTGETQISSMDAPHLYNTTDAGLISYWPMDETSGTTIADVKSGYNGTAVGGMRIADGVFGKGRQVYSSYQYATIPSNASLNITGSFTISGWVRNDYLYGSPSGYNNLFYGIIASKTSASTSTAGGYGLFGSYGALYCRTSNGSTYTESYTNSPGSYGINTDLMHVAAVYNSGSGSCRIYINGVDRTAYDPVHVAPSANSLPLNIGSQGDSNSGSYSIFDEVRLYNVPLSLAQVQDLYAKGLTSSNGYRMAPDTSLKTEGTASLRLATANTLNDADVISSWHMDETGTTLMDSTGNGYNGTAVGTTVVKGISGNGRSFNGSTDYVSIPGPSYVGLPLTIEAWIYSNGIQGTWETIFRQNENATNYYGAWLQILANNGLELGYGNGGVAGPASRRSLQTGNYVIPPYQWVHVAGVIRGETDMMIYVNGNRVGGTYSGTGTYYSKSSDPGSIGKTFNGRIDEVRFSDHARTQPEILESYRMSSDNYFTLPLTSTDLSGKTTLPFYIAADRPGTYLQTVAGKSAFANYVPDANTIGFWHFDEPVASSYLVQRDIYYGYNGTEQTAIVPFGTYRVFMKSWGGGGGGGGSTTAGATGGGGGFASGYVSNNPSYGGGNYTTIEVGGGGQNGTTCVTGTGGGAGGYGSSYYGAGGARGGNAGTVGCSSGGGGGGGSSWNYLDSWMGAMWDVVAGGGGGGSGGETAIGGAGGTGGQNGATGYCSGTGGTTNRGDYSMDGGPGGDRGGADGSGGGGGGGGAYGGWGGLAPTCDSQGGGGGAGGYNTAGTGGTTATGSNQQPGNYTDPDRTIGAAIGGWRQGAGSAGRIAIEQVNEPGVVYDLKDSSGYGNHAYASGTTGGKVGAPVSFGYTGGWQTYVVPNGITRISVKGWGGGGGAGGGGGYGATGGGGAYANSTIPVVPGETLYISVGGGGGVGATSVTGTGGGTGGGGVYGPGARGGNAGTTGASCGGGGGGGGTYILRDANVIIYAAAGGGGGAGAETGGNAGAGGGGGQNGYAGSVAGGTTGAVWYAATGTTIDKGAGDASAGGGGGGGQFGGSAGAAATADSVGGGGGAGGSSYGDTIMNGSAATPGNSGDAERTGNAGGGAALGGNGAAGLLIIRPVELGTSNGILGNARNFNLASTDAVTFPAITLNVPYTIDSWVQFPIPLSANWRTLFARNGGTYHYAIVQAGANNLGVYNSGFYPCGWDPTSVSGWHHLALVAAGDGYTQFYLDGQRICRSATQISGQPIGVIGNYASNGTQGVGTSIDEVRISNVARSQDDLRQAFEIGARSHNVTIDFAARLSGDLITGSADYSFTVNGTGFGLNYPASNLYVGDKIIAREIISSTTYTAQGTVTSVNTGSGAVTVSSWDAGSTFPAGGFSANADIFKWQREYWNITQPLDTQVNTTSFLTMRVLNGGEGRNIWIDDLRSNTNYIAQSSPSLFDPRTGTGTYTVAPGVTSTLNRYFQYRIINSSNDDAVAPQVTSTLLDYESNYRPNAPVITSPSNGATGTSLTPTIQLSSTDSEGNYLRYKIQIATDINFSQNVQTFDQTLSQTGWTGQDTQGGTAYSSGLTASYTIQSALTGSTTYYIRSYAVDPGGSKQWSNVSTTVSFTTNTKPNAPVISAPLNGAVSQPLTPVIQLAATDTESNYLRYKIQIATDAGFSSIVQTIDQTLSQTGWTGQNDQGGTAYTSGTTATYTVQTPLTGNTTYYIRAYAVDPGGSTQWSVASSTVSFTTNYKPNAPSISSPSNGAIGLGMWPTIILSATDPETDYLRYKIQLATDAGFSQNLQTFDETLSQTGWTGQNVQGGTAYASGANASYQIQSSLQSGTLYYIRAYAVDPGGSIIWSNVSSTISFRTNYKPNPPTITLPLNGATGVSLNPLIRMSATDPDGDYVNYILDIATDSNFTQNYQQINERSSQTGWTGQDAQGGTAYLSGSTATYTVQTPLLVATTYYLRACAVDPGGTNIYCSDLSSVVSFTTGSLGTPAPCLANLLGNVGPIRVDWTDTSVIEQNYLIEVSINSGGWNQVDSLPANSTSDTFSSINPLTTYQYRIRAQAAGNQYSAYCTTNSVTTFTYGDLLFEKVMFENLKMN